MGVLCRLGNMETIIQDEVDLDDLLRGALAALPLRTNLCVLLSLETDNRVASLATHMWPNANWADASAEEVDVAVDVVCRWGRSGALRAAEIGGREGELQRRFHEQQLCNALALLPLRRLKNSQKLLAPDLPCSAALLQMLQRMEELEGTTARMQKDLIQANREIATLHSELRDARSDNARLRCKVANLENVGRDRK